MRGIVIGLVAMSLIFVLVDKAMAEQQIIEVRPSDKELYETEPRQIITTSFRISNNSKERRELEAQVKIPSGWKLITREFLFELGPEESDVRLVSFFVPQNTLAGKYEVIYLVQDRMMPSISDFWTISVIVLSVAKLEAKVLEAPVWIIAGKDYTVSFLVINGANATTTIVAEIESGHGWLATADSKEFQLGPGELKIVKVTVKTEKLRRTIKHRLKMTTMAPELKNGKVEASVTSWVKIVPRTSATAERFHKIPAEFRLRGAGEQNKASRQGFQAELSGVGTLDEQGKQHISFLFRGPGLRDKSILGEYDELRLSHWTDKYEVHLGDKVYSLSPLTEYYRYGRGIEGKVKLNDFTIGGYRKKSRWFRSENKELAGYINYLLAEKYTFALNCLKKTPSGHGILSFQAQLEPSEDVSLELEAASGKKNGERDNAYFLRMTGNQKWFSGYLRLVYAGANYPGYYRDIDDKSGGAVLYLWDKLKLNTDFYTRRQNLELNPALYYAPEEKFYRSGLSYRIKTGTRFSLSYGSRSREDRLPKPKYNYQEDTFRLELGQSFPRISFWVAGEKGNRDDKLQQRSYDLKKYSAFAFCQPFKWLSLNGSVQVRNELYQRTTAGLNTLLRINKRSFCKIDWQSRWQDSVYISKLVDISLEHQFLNDYQLMLRARRVSYKNSRVNAKARNSFLFELGIPFGLPIARKKGVGQLNGVLYDAESKQKLADVLIRINEAAAVTDKDGKFGFPFLKPGKHYLEVDKVGIGLDKITLQKMPLEVVIEGGQETQIEIGVTRSATLKGQVLVYGAQNHQNNFLNHKGINNAYIIGEGNNGNSLDNANTAGDGKLQFVKSYELASILVEVTNGSEVKWRITDRKGHFEFAELCPGQWKLKAYDTNLPRYHHFEKDTFRFDLKPGQRKEILVKVFPKKRPIRIIGEGGVLEEK